MMLGLYRAMHNHEFAVTDPTLERLLERAATPLRSILEATIVQD